MRASYLRIKIVLIYKHLALFVVLLLTIAGCYQGPQPDLIPPPTADFTADNPKGQAPLTVRFTCSSTGDITHRHWDYGDGQFSTELSPSHTYTLAGEYTVSLTVMGPGGSDVETKTGYISVGRTTIKWDEAGSYIGQNKAVEGVIVATYYASNSKSRPTFLNFHIPYKGYFTCVIWGTDRAKFIQEFPPDPETYFLNKRVLVKGLIEEYPEGSGDPEMILRDPSQIEIIAE